MAENITIAAKDVERRLAETRERLGRGDEQERRILGRLARLRESWPGLAGAFGRLRPSAEDVRTVGVRADGQMAFSVGWVSRLVDADLDFVLMHEAMHLERGTHARASLHASPSVVRAMNLAHDSVINACLSEATCRLPPAGGVAFPGAGRLLPEILALQFLASMSDDSDLDYDVLGAAEPNDDPILGHSSLSSNHWADSLDRLRGADGVGNVSIAASEFAALATVREMRAKRPDVVGWGRPDGVFKPTREALEPGLEEAIAEVFVAASLNHERTWSRPSRRSEERRGRIQRGRELNVLLDTSGSMLPWFEEALGLVRVVAERFGVERLRLIQCDGPVMRDEELALPADLAEVHIVGTSTPELFLVRTPCESCGKIHAWVIGDAPPTRLDAGLLHLQSEGVEAAIVLTDGLVYAGSAIDVDLSWFVFGQGFGFVPPNGRSASLRARSSGHKS